MCLLDSVERWDASSILCLACSHRDDRNPLRRGDRLEALCGLEYAAQTMAVHVGLSVSTKHRYPAIGYLGAVRDLKVYVQHLDDIEDDLKIEARRLIGSETRFLYSFLVAAGRHSLLSGRASIFLRYQTEER